MRVVNENNKIVSVVIDNETHEKVLKLAAEDARSASNQYAQLIKLALKFIENGRK